MSINVNLPSIHGVSDLAAEVDTIDAGSGSFTYVTLKFLDEDGQQIKLRVHFEMDAVDRARIIVDAINNAAASSEGAL